MAKQVPDRALVIVGIGASAGGFEAFEQFFANMPTASDLAFVVITHLAPTSKSLMAELLAMRTEMTVAQAQDGMRVEPNRVYVAPPGAELTIHCGRLHVAVDQPPHRPVLPVDRFLSSLAEDRGENAVGIILSGTGADGTLGLKAIKGHGGLSLAQDPVSAKYDDMPRSAIATGQVDVILPAGEMPKALLEHARDVHHPAYERQRPERDGEIGPHLTKIFLLLRKQTGHDFTHYKQSTILRRIARRMQLLGIERAADYVALMRGSLEETQLLFKELLIGVTQFFRDPAAFADLGRDIIRPLFAELREPTPVRIWVPGCATGEEAYSIALLLAEEAEAHRFSPEIQIFATDIDENALAFARAGIYPDSIAADVSPERLERFFIHEGDTCRVIGRIREMVVFSSHDLIKDPPFSKLDLVSCRNVLIYLGQELQTRLLSLFHYALVPGGTLFLGPSETIGSATRLFSEKHKKHRIFRRKASVTRSQVRFPLFPVDKVAGPDLASIEAGTSHSDVDLGRAVDQALLKAYAPASVVIDENLNVVLFHGHTGKYLEAPSGVPDLNVVNMARWGLRLRLRAAIHLASRQQCRVVEPDVRVRNDGVVQPINLVVQPLVPRGSATSLQLIIFEDSGRQEPATSTADDLDVTSEDPAVLHLESELRNTQEHLQASVEELETANEELKSTNEELLSMNEELQSTNEELETSKEEGQSVNEELETVNAELNRKLEELDRVNSDMTNLLSSLQIATIFLSNDLQIKRFTPAIIKIFHLIPSDVGRPITDIAQRISYDRLAEDVSSVLRDLSVIERQVRTENGTWCMLQIRPYRTAANVIDGVVVTFVDITGLKHTEQALQEGLEQHRSWVESSPVCIHELDLEGRLLTMNPAGLRLFNLEGEDDAAGVTFLDTIAPADRPRIAFLLEQAYAGKMSEFEFKPTTSDDSRAFASSIIPVNGEDGSVVKLVGCTFDISELKRAEVALKRANKELMAQLKESG